MGSSNSLLSNTLEPLSLGSIQPAGWLLQQSRIQATGLSGHLDEFWPDIADSSWIGGKSEGWERAPYWLDGLVPLAFLLDDEVLKGKVRYWIDYILEHQHVDGWLGPVLDDKYGYKYDPWPLFVLMKALTQYQEATADTRIVPALERLLRRMQILLTQAPLQSWAYMRGAELLITVYWLYRRTGASWLLDLVQQVQSQSYDWQAQYADFPYKERQAEWTLENHLVNHMMAVKQPALNYQFSHDEREREAIKSMLETLETYHGQITGMYTGDEVLAGKNPSQGTELCAVVEYMYSLEVLLGVLGDANFADRLERVAFNALPATFKPDMWAHQYDQQVNQVMCAVSEEHVFATNGPEANLFGLEPHFGCCTANMHQGWPKFSNTLWMRTTDPGLAAISYTPCVVDTQITSVPMHIEVHTNYPFEEGVTITIAVQDTVSFPLLLRIPAWAQQASVSIGDEKAEGAPAGEFYRIEQEWSGMTTLRLQLPMAIQAQRGYHDSITLERGPLVYALRISEEWRQLRGDLPHADWEVYPTSPWNYALQIDPAQPGNDCSIVQHHTESALFAPDDAPLSMHVRGRRIPQWTLTQNAAGPLPLSPVTSHEPLEELILIPYGCTNLRVTEFPLLQ